MSNILKVSKIVLATSIVALVLVVCTGIPAITHAQAYDYGCCDTSYGWGDSDTSYSWGGSDYSYGWGDSDYSYDWGGSDYSYGWGDDYAYTYEPSNDYAYTYEPSNDYAYTYEPSYDNYAYTYEPTYSYGGGYDFGGGSYGGGSNYGMGYSTWVPSYSQPPRTTGGSSSYYSNTVTNTNITNNDNDTHITNIDNSIRDSFNNYNSGNTSIVVATPQVPVVQTYPAPYCTINHALSGGHYNYGNNSAYLSWSSTNATSAYLSNVGSVETSGSRTVYPGYTTTYTLTVYGQNGQSATCSTTVQGYTYTPPVQPPVYIPPVVQQPYVSLTQIPYTGFDLGPIGNALYWAALIAFAFAGSYLMIYYRGGAFAFAGTMLPKRTRKPLPAVIAPKAPILVEKEAAALRAEEVRVAPIVASLRKSAGTNDSMAIVKANDGSMPRIVINRS